MTPRQSIAALARRWYVVIMVLALTIVGVALLPRGEGVYWSRATVVFIPPINPSRAGNVLEGSDPSLIYFAAAVERTVNGGQQQARLSGDAGLYGFGITDGWTVTLQNSGGQWQTNFNRPMLTVEVVATSPTEASHRMATLLESIETVSEGMQTLGDAPESSRITVEVSPNEPSVSFIGGNWKRAAAGLLAVGMMVAVSSALLLDRLLRRKAPSSEEPEVDHKEPAGDHVATVSVDG